MRDAVFEDCHHSECAELLRPNLTDTMGIIDRYNLVFLLYIGVIIFLTETLEDKVRHIHLTHTTECPLRHITLSVIRLPCERCRSEYNLPLALLPFIHKVNILCRNLPLRCRLDTDDSTFFNDTKLATYTSWECALRGIENTSVSLHIAHRLDERSQTLCRRHIDELILDGVREEEIAMVLSSVL